VIVPAEPDSDVFGICDLVGGKLIARDLAHVDNHLRFGVNGEKQCDEDEKKEFRGGEIFVSAHSGRQLYGSGLDFYPKVAVDGMADRGLQ